MSLVSLKEILENARKKKCIVGYFEAWDYSSLKTILKVAEEENSPVIIGFGGRSFKTSTCWDRLKIASFASMAKVIAQNSSVPTSCILNEVKDVNIIEEGMKHGFNSVMFEGNFFPLAKNIELTRQVVKKAAPMGVNVEGQVGKIPSKGEGVDKNFSTSVWEAVQFVEKTHVTALAVSVGNIHMATDEKFSVDLDLLEKIHKATDIPLVMHGGTGFPDSLIPEVIKRGVYKFNVGTILKKAFLEKLKEVLGRINLTGVNFHDLVGSNKKEDILDKAYLEVKRLVREKIRVYNSLIL